MLPSSSVPSPAAWLQATLEKSGTPQSVLTRLLGVDKSVFSRYVRGEEQAPRLLLAKLAQELEPDEYEHVLCLKDCEDFTDAVRRATALLAASLQAGVGGRPATRLGPRGARECLEGAAGALAARLADALLQGVHGILAQEPVTEPTRLAGRWRRHLLDAARAVDLVRKTVDSAYTLPLLLPASVPGFRYPINHFVGRLLELDTLVRPGTLDAGPALLFRERMLDNLRRTVWPKQSAAGTLDVLAREFTAHVLSRHGDTEDRHDIQALLRRGADQGGPLLRRLSFTGLVLGRRDRETADRFLWDLQRDRTLAEVNLLFNAFHYGDVAFHAGQALPRRPRSFDRAVPHILRHLEHPEDYQSLLPTECLTLTHVLQACGPRPFQRPAVLRRLRGLLGADAGGLAQLPPAVRKAFTKQFGPFLKASP